MDSYRLEFKNSAFKELQRLPANIVERIWSALEGLRTDPRPSGCKKLVNGDGEYRIRVGEYRVVYLISDQVRVVRVTRVAHRGEVYE